MLDSLGGRRRYARKKLRELAELNNINSVATSESSPVQTFLSSCYHIQLPAYHGGKLIGKDCQKMMSNADVIFKQFADILKDPSNRRSDCALNNDEIDLLCQQFADLSMLWDGALSYASKIDPSEEDIVMYERFAKAAIFSHQSMGCSVTHKGHLMWAHTACQMRNIPGGLGDKREDWVEKGHQEGKNRRIQYRTTPSWETRANAMAKQLQRDSIPELMERIVDVHQDTATGPRKDFVSVEAVRKEERDRARMYALRKWEELSCGNEEVVACNCDDGDVDCV
jgi:hypothetical protein